MTRKQPQPSPDDTNIRAPRESDQRSEAAAFPFCGDLDMRIARDGTWYYQGTPIGRPALVKLFSTVLRREEDGSYWLVTPVERGRILVEDAPFTAVELAVDGAGRDQTLAFRTNVDTWVEAGDETPISVVEDEETGEPRPYVRVRDRLDALIVRSVYYELVNLASAAPDAAHAEDPDPQSLGVWSNGVFFPLGGPS